jgi:hypothetical protein
MAQFNYITTTINTAATHTADIPTAFEDYNFDVEVNASTATGTIALYNINDTMSSSFTQNPFQTIQVVSGKFGNTRCTVTNGSTPSASVLRVIWTPTSTPTGSIVFYGRSIE